MHSVTIHVRTYECDAYGHVNNAVYLNYLEYARDRWIASHDLDYSAIVSRGLGIFVAEAKLIYQAPAFPGQALTITTIANESGAAWVTLKQSIIGPEGRSILEAQMKLVWVGSTGRPTRIPPDWKAKLFKVT